MCFLMSCREGNLFLCIQGDISELSKILHILQVYHGREVEMGKQMGSGSNYITFHSIVLSCSCTVQKFPARRSTWKFKKKKGGGGESELNVRERMSNQKQTSTLLQKIKIG